MLKPALVVASALLLAQGALLHRSERDQFLPELKPLASFPRTIGNWTFLQDAVVEPEIRDFLKADDLLSRNYLDASGKGAANLFVAAFRTLSNGASPHSPKNCLPASGWTPLVSKRDHFKYRGPAHFCESLHCRPWRRAQSGAVLVSIARASRRQ